MDLLPDRTRGFLHVFPLGPGIRQIRVRQHANHGGVWSQSVQHFQSLRSQLSESLLVVGNCLLCKGEQNPFLKQDYKDEFEPD
jgi:hypothetical protein